MPTSPTELKSRSIQVIKPDQAEKDAQAFSPANLRAALKALDEDGIVVLEEVVSLDSVEKLSAKMRADMEEVKKSRPVGKASSNESLSPPLNHPWLFKEICYNEFVIQVNHALLGNGLYWNFYASSTVHPYEGRKQETHHDTGPLFPSPMHDYPTPPHLLVVNIPLTDFTEENGATEVWLGSHKETRTLTSPFNFTPAEGTDIYESLLEERRQCDTVLQMTARKGSAVIRDIRIYHGGMPNKTGQLRQMISMVHSRPWLRCRTWMVFAEGTEDFFNHPVLEAQCSFMNPEELSIDGYVDRQKKGLTPLTSIPGEAWGGPNEWQHGLMQVKREEWDNPQ